MWWIPQVPCTPFYVLVRTVREAVLLLDVLADYDLFQYKNRIKPDYANTGGLEIWEADNPSKDGCCWSEWCSDEGMTIDEYVKDNPELLDGGAV